MWHNLKKLLICIFCLSFFIAGCSSQDVSTDEQADIFVLEKELSDAYTQKIEEVLYDFYWDYDLSSLEFSEGVCPQGESDYESLIFDASLLSGYDLSSYAGKDAIIGDIDITFYSGEQAGNSVFYFIDDELAGTYFIPAENESMPSPLDTRNVYTPKADFKVTESDQPYTNFKAVNAKISQTGFCSKSTINSQTALCSINNDLVYVYLCSQRPSLYRTFSFNDETGYPISATFVNVGNTDYIAVLTGSFSETSDESFVTVPDIAEKIIFYNLSTSQNVLTVENISPTTSCVFFDENMLTIFSNKTVSYYNIASDFSGIEKAKMYTLGNNVKAAAKADLDNSGSREYIFTDGNNLYIYSKNDDIFELLWKTHIATENFTGYIYCGDLNSDGAKEIYINDTTGTTVRYVLDKRGLVTKNADINYGQQLFVADINGDGFDDYISLTDFENNIQKLYIAE